MSSEKALIVKLSSLGDLFHALPAVHALKQTHNWSIDWITQPEYVPVVQCFTDIDNVLPFPRRRIIRSGTDWIRALRRKRYDIVIDFQGLLKSALITRLARAKQRIGPSWHREGAGIFYSQVLGHRDKARHAIDEACELAAGLDAPVDSIQFPIQFPAHPHASESPRIAYVPCSRWTTKNAPPSLFAGCIQELHRRHGGTAFLIGSSADRDTANYIQSQVQDVDLRNVCGTTSLVELGSLLQEMDLVVTVDSGPMHMAAALGCPVVALFGPTDPHRTGPYGETHCIIQRTDLTCVPCHSRRCQRPQRDHACMSRWSATDIIDSCETLL